MRSIISKVKLGMKWRTFEKFDKKTQLWKVVANSSKHKTFFGHTENHKSKQSYDVFYALIIDAKRFIYLFFSRTTLYIPWLVIMQNHYLR